jgi:hypothetical protein
MRLSKQNDGIGEVLMLRNAKKIQAQSSSKVVEKEYSIARCVCGRSASLSPY